MLEMKCANCGAENSAGLKFWEQCATPIKKRCAQCGFENSAAARFCGECAASLSAAAPESWTQQPGGIPTVQLLPKKAEAGTLEGERRTVTALFADIKGSTELMEDLDPEEARAIVDPALRLMIEAVRHHDGYIVQSTGDGIFALFGAPVAHEDHPQRALYAALRLQEELKRYSARVVADGSSPIQGCRSCRTGSASGLLSPRLLPTLRGRRKQHGALGARRAVADQRCSVAPPSHFVPAGQPDPGGVRHPVTKM
jgi:double zinc ribbon protein/adenylate/guanylate cyclase family protein